MIWAKWQCYVDCKEKGQNIAVSQVTQSDSDRYKRSKGEEESSWRSHILVTWRMPARSAASTRSFSSGRGPSTSSYIRWLFYHCVCKGEGVDEKNIFLRDKSLPIIKTKAKSISWDSPFKLIFPECFFKNTFILNRRIREDYVQHMLKVDRSEV